MNFKETFLALTEYTIPFGEEYIIEHLLPKGLTKDSFGNYFISIGNSETLFCCHLDSATNQKVKVKHVIEGNIIKTDGTSILGADNKAGVCILMYLIEQGVAGTYYFFVGEERGCIGSKKALDSNKVFFSKFKRAIAFDRKKTGSIITVQLDEFCCSEDFSRHLSNKFNDQGLCYSSDDTGVFTDTATFMSVIPECTNLSCGVWNEHTYEEYVNIAVVERIAKAAANIDWESLITARIPRR